jgi:hypothetical protein
MVAVVPIFGELPFSTVFSHRITGGFSDVVMGTNEDQVIGVIEEMPDRLHFRRGCRLFGAEGVKADYHDGIDAGKSAIERGHRAIISDAFDLNDRIACQRLGLFDESLENWFLNMVQKAGDALIELAAVRQPFKFRKKEPAQLEDRWKPIVDYRKWCTSLGRTAAAEIEKYMSCPHPHLGAS